MELLENNSYDLSLIKKTETQRKILLKIWIEGWYSGSFNKIHIKTSDCDFQFFKMLYYCFSTKLKVPNF